MIHPDTQEGYLRETQQERPNPRPRRPFRLFRATIVAGLVVMLGAWLMALPQAVERFQDFRWMMVQ